MSNVKRVKSIVVRTAISLRAGEDDDLIELFRKVPPRKRAVFIKAGLRNGASQVQLDGLPDDDELADSLDNFLS